MKIKYLSRTPETVEIILKISADTQRVTNVIPFPEKGRDFLREKWEAEREKSALDEEDRMIRHRRIYHTR